MERDELLAKYADVVSNESCVEAYVYDGALFYRYEWLNPVEMIDEIINYKLDGSETEDPRGVKVALGPMYKATKNGEKVK